VCPTLTLVKGSGAQGEPALRAGARCGPSEAGISLVSGLGFR
jgi:hypothetical protein